MFGSAGRRNKPERHQSMVIIAYQRNLRIMRDNAFVFPCGRYLGVNLFRPEGCQKSNISEIPGLYLKHDIYFHEI